MVCVGVRRFDPSFIILYTTVAQPKGWVLGSKAPLSISKVESSTKTKASFGLYLIIL